MDHAPASILVVDDNPQISQLVCEALCGSGYECLSASSVRQAAELLNRRPVAVLIADLAPPERSGLELVGLVRQAAPACKVVLITGLATMENLAEALRLGVYDYLEKPFEIHSLVAVVRSAIAAGTDGRDLAHRAAQALRSDPRGRQNCLETIRALVRAVEAKDPYTRRHSEQVAHYATHLARHLALPDGRVESVRIASLVHDVGKIGIPDHVLTKPSVLTKEEFQYIRVHPTVGAEIVENITILANEARLVRHHHEQWNGQGYPDGLAGEEIPLEARIINVADSIDAMLMRRTYKDAYSSEHMINELVRCAGTQFDPRVAAAAVEWCGIYPDKLILTGQAVDLHFV